MRLIRYIPIAVVLLLLVSVSGCSTTPMNKQEAAEWYGSYHSMVRWVGYQGSDHQFHFFIARVMDDWAFIRIKKGELTVPDERPYRGTSSSQLYYYLVDASRDYRKVEP
jgi:hypothetical protein